MAEESIVTIELGSSKITGIAREKNLDGSISILAVIRKDSTPCIHKGVVFNIDKTVLYLTNIIKRLETTLKTSIARVYVGAGGQSIRSVKDVIIKDLPAGTVATQDMINELMDANRSMTYAEQEILDAVTREYKVDALYQLDPASISCLRLEDSFLNVLRRKTFYRNLGQCLNKTGAGIVKLYLAPLALIDAVLAEAKKRTGYALIDLGADTATVLVYYENTLRYPTATPLGNENATKDIASLLVEDNQAEQMKLKYVPAYTDNSDTDNNREYLIGQNRKVESRKFIEIIESRLQEVIGNVFHQIPNEYADKLIGGIILTGGGSNIPSIEKAFTNQASVEKIRIAEFVNQNINSNLPEITAHTGAMGTILGLLAKGDINYAGEGITADLFQSNEPKYTTSTPAPAKGPRSYTKTSGTGIVQTEEGKELLHKKREKQEEAEWRAQEEGECRITKEKGENSPVNKIWRSVKNFASKITREEG